MILQIHGEDDAFSPTNETKETLVLFIDCSQSPYFSVRSSRTSATSGHLDRV